MIVRPFVDNNRGAAAVEFALVSMTFIMLLFGIEEVARYVASKQDLMTAVHAAGRYAVVHGSGSSSPASAASLQQYVGSKLYIIPASSLTSTVTFSPNNSAGGTVTITANYTWSPLISIPSLPAATISAKSVATILY